MKLNPKTIRFAIKRGYKHRDETRKDLPNRDDIELWLRMEYGIQIATNRSKSGRFYPTIEYNIQNYARYCTLRLYSESLDETIERGIIHALSETIREIRELRARNESENKVCVLKN